MEFGIFMEFETREGQSQPRAFNEAFDLVDATEEWGLDTVWLGEMHFSPRRSVLSEPIVVGSAIAARTERLRIGVAVRVLPLSHPLRIAEETATLDQISEGRLDFGIGRSGSPRSYDALGIEYGESQPRFREALAVILEAWRGEPFSHHGEFYSFDEIAVSPRTHQQPHPPLRMAATSAGHLRARRPARSPHLRRPSRQRCATAAGAPRHVPCGVARGRSPVGTKRRRRCSPAHPGLCGADPARGDRGAARQHRVLPRTPGGDFAHGARSRWRRTGRGASSRSGNASRA